MLRKRHNYYSKISNTKILILINKVLNYGAICGIWLNCYYYRSVTRTQKSICSRAVVEKFVLNWNQHHRWLIFQTKRRKDSAYACGGAHLTILTLLLFCFIFEKTMTHSACKPILDDGGGDDDDDMHFGTMNT